MYQRYLKIPYRNAIALVYTSDNTFGWLPGDAPFNATRGGEIDDKIDDKKLGTDQRRLNDGQQTKKQKRALMISPHYYFSIIRNRKSKIEIVNQLRSVSSISFPRISCVKIFIKGDDFFCLTEAKTILKQFKSILQHLGSQIYYEYYWNWINSSYIFIFINVLLRFLIGFNWNMLPS